MKRVKLAFADFLDMFDSRKIVRFILYLGVLLFLLVFITAFNSIFLAVLIFMLASVSTFYKLYLKIPIGFELITLMVILFSFSFGIMPAIVTMILSVSIARLISAGIHPEMFAQMAAYIFIIFIAQLFSGSSIVFSGMVLVIIFNLIRFLYSMFIFGFEPISTTMSCIGSIIIYYFILSSFGQMLLSAIS